MQIFLSLKDQPNTIKLLAERILVYLFKKACSQHIAGFKATSNNLFGYGVSLPITYKSICVHSRLFADFYQFDKVIEDWRHIVWAWAGFRMSLETECRFVGAVDTLQRTVKQ